MMKKLLVLVLVVAMVSAANAALSLQIVDNGNGTLGIKSLTNYTGGADDTYFCVISAAPTYPSGGAKTAGAPAATEVIYPSDLASIVVLPAGWNGMGGFIGDPFAVPVAAGLYVDGITSNMQNNVCLYLITPAGDLGALVECVTLVPEPASMLLLGLGGLFLRRRK